MSKHVYKTTGTCSVQIEFELAKDKVNNITFTGGCKGNLKGIAALAEGMEADELITKLSGIACGRKATSCPDQLANAVKQAISNKQ